MYCSVFDHWVTNGLVSSIAKLPRQFWASHRAPRFKSSALSVITVHGLTLPPLYRAICRKREWSQWMQIDLLRHSRMSWNSHTYRSYLSTLTGGWMCCRPELDPPEMVQLHAQFTLHQNQTKAVLMRTIGYVYTPANEDSLEANCVKSSGRVK